MSKTTFVAASRGSCTAPAVLASVSNLLTGASRRLAPTDFDTATHCECRVELAIAVASFSPNMPPHTGGVSVRGVRRAVDDVRHGAKPVVPQTFACVPSTLASSVMSRRPGPAASDRSFNG